MNSFASYVTSIKMEKKSQFDNDSTAQNERNFRE